jgi:hypothetical protein
MKIQASRISTVGFLNTDRNSCICNQILELDNSSRFAGFDGVATALTISKYCTHKAM